MPTRCIEGANLAPEQSQVLTNGGYRQLKDQYPDSENPTKKTQNRLDSHRLSHGRTWRVSGPHESGNTAVKVGKRFLFVLFRHPIVSVFQHTTPQYIISGDMAHTIRDKKKLLDRVRRVRGQIEAVERLLEGEKDCVEILQQIAACRGSINGLMSEVLEGHIRFHLVDRDQGRKSRKGNAVEEVVGIAKSYLK